MLQLRPRGPTLAADRRDDVEGQSLFRLGFVTPTLAVSVRNTNSVLRRQGVNSFCYVVCIRHLTVRYRGRSGRIAHLTFIRIKNILNANPSIGNLPHGMLRYVYLV